MNRIFSNEPDKRKFIINELKEYTEQGDMNRLASSLNRVLVTPQQRLLLNEIKPFIPSKQQTLFDNLTSLHNSSTVFNKQSEAAVAVAGGEGAATRRNAIRDAVIGYEDNKRRESSAERGFLDRGPVLSDPEKFTNNSRNKFVFEGLSSPPIGKR